MADHTVAAIIGIVAIVLVFGVFIAGQGQPAISTPQESAVMTETLAGQAFSGAQSQSADTCKPKRYCDGTKLSIVNEDCSMNYAFCQFGCSDARCI